MKKTITILLCVMALCAGATPIDHLLERIDKGASSKFKIELVKSGQDFFELDQSGSRVVVRGNTWVNIATGINWYLKYHAGIHLTWNNMQAQLPSPLPRMAQRERHETNLKWRYDFNYCTFSYTMAFWDWERWQQEIDWMALHGVNMPLAIVGEECVWRNMLLKLGYTEEDIGKFIAGPAFLAWWEMNNLEGWGGPLPLSWYERQERLQKQILQRMKEYGMHPVLPGYAGMVPHDARERLGLDVADAGLWNGFQRPANLLPTDARFAEIANLYYRELTRLFGKADFYSIDPFHESNDDSRIDYGAAALALLRAMKVANPKATWVVQGWTENPRQQMLDVLEPKDLLILDLFSECRPMWGAPSVWRRPEGYGKHRWLFCMLENFGANVGLHGRMDQLLHNYQLTKSHPLASHLCGTGFTMEGSENNPIMFELMSELPWRSETFTKEGWVKSYVKARYGSDEPELQQAWQFLINGIYNCPLGNNQQGPHESIFCGRPTLNNFQASSWSKMRNYYDPASTLEAARLMNSVSERHRGNNNFEYDLVDITRQAIADQARIQYQLVVAAYKSASPPLFNEASERFMQLLSMQDELLATRKEFRLGRWLEMARSCGTTNEEKDFYEWNARVQITTWGNRYCADTGGLRDYAHKEWQGLLSDFYAPRWKAFFNHLRQDLEKMGKPNPDMLGTGVNSNKTADELFKMALPQEVLLDYYPMEEDWVLHHPHNYTANPEGNPVDVARKVFNLLTEEK